MNKREYVIAGTLAAIRSGRDFDQEALIEQLGGLYDLIPADEAAQDDGWQDWNGQKPYPEGQVDVMFRGGEKNHNRDADSWVWTVDGFKDDIVKWRPAR